MIYSGSLDVYTNSSGSRTLVWTQFGNKNNAWFNGQVSIVSAKSFRLTIEATRGKSISSDIAIDDLEIIERACTISPDNAWPVNQVTIPMQTTTKSLRPPNAFDCTFEKGFCTYTVSDGSTFNWVRAQGKTGNQVGGPLETDHTLGIPNGWYIFAPLTNRKENDVARIESGNLATPRCVEFYYYADTNLDYILNVYYKRGTK